MITYTSTFETPLGPFSVAVNDRAHVVATAFGTLNQLRKRLRSGQLLEDRERTAMVEQQVIEYFRGERRLFSLPLAAIGTPFQHEVWKTLQTVPYGRTASYGEIATLLNRPKAARAVGRANGTNPICLIVPCHRVIGADGSLTGFAFGEEIKGKLLAHERALTAGRV